MDIFTYLSQNWNALLELAGTLLISLLLKDVISNFVAGCLFYFNKAFNEGDEVFVDGDRGIVVKVGLRTTIFGVECPRGYVWRYVPNTQIKWLKLEKVVRPREIQEMQNKDN